jgi:hypothetical protein
MTPSLFCMGCRDQVWRARGRFRMRGAHATSYSKCFQYACPPLELLSVGGKSVCERLSVEKSLRVLAGYFNVQQKSEMWQARAATTATKKKWWRHLAGIFGAYSQEESRWFHCPGRRSAHSNMKSCKLRRCANNENRQVTIFKVMFQIKLSTYKQFPQN